MELRIFALRPPRPQDLYHPPVSKKGTGTSKATGSVHAACKVAPRYGVVVPEGQGWQLMPWVLYRPWGQGTQPRIDSLHWDPARHAPETTDKHSGGHIMQCIGNYTPETRIWYIITCDANSLSWAEIWAFSRSPPDVIDDPIITKLIIFDSSAKFNYLSTLQPANMAPNAVPGDLGHRRWNRILAAMATNPYSLHFVGNAILFHLNTQKNAFE